MNVVAWLFLEIRSGVYLLTRNVNLCTSYKVEFGRNRFSRRAVYNLQTKIQFLEKLT